MEEVSELLELVTYSVFACTGWMFPTTVHEEGELRMKFTFMTKKGHKQQLKDLNIPIDSDLASNIHEAREALKDQHQEMKKLVLNYEQKQEEEEYLGEGERERERKRDGNTNITYNTILYLFSSYNFTKFN